MEERKIVAYGDSLTDSSYPRHLATVIDDYLSRIGNPFAVRVFGLGIGGMLFSENERGHDMLEVVLDAKPDTCIVLGLRKLEYRRRLNDKLKTYATNEELSFVDFSLRYQQMKDF